MPTLPYSRITCRRTLSLLASSGKQHGSRALYSQALQALVEAYSDQRMAMAAAYVSGPYTLKAIAAYFGVHSSTVSRAVRQAEGQQPPEHPCMLARPDPLSSPGMLSGPFSCRAHNLNACLQDLTPHRYYLPRSCPAMRQTANYGERLGHSPDTASRQL
jgi:AraC-like DNA-binding protein